VSGWAEAAPGALMRLVHCSPSLVVTEARLSRGARVPRHSHASVQVTVVLRGRLLLRVEGLGEKLLGPGDYLVIPPGAPHEAEAVEETTVLDVNAPLTPDRAELVERLWRVECPGAGGVDAQPG